MDVALWWKRVDYLALLGLLVFNTSNPLFKISMALRVGLHCMLYTTYAIVVYLKSFQSVTQNTSNGNVVSKLFNTIPTLFSKLSNFFLLMATKTLQFVGVLSLNNSANINSFGNVITFMFIFLRKIMALCCWCYITSDDDNDTHLKTLAVFCVFNLIHYRFVIAGHSTFKQAPKLSLLEGINTIFVKGSKQSHSKCSILKFQRSFYFVLTLIGTCFIFWFLFNGYFDNTQHYSTYMTFIVKLIFIIDSFFAHSLFIELSGLSFSFVNTDQSHV